MNLTLLLVCSLSLVSIQRCNAQKQSTMQEQQNPLLCDPETGVCEIPGMQAATSDSNVISYAKPVKLIYFTDPICSSCWGIEPQLRKLKLAYGTYLDIEYRMGGLLPDWSYNSGGISKPSDVAHHWDEVSIYYDMPIDGDVWLEDPLHSSFPPSIAFKAAQMQDQAKAVKFLREIREMVFLQKKNITKWEFLAQAAATVGLDATKLKTDVEAQATELFEADLNEARSMGVRGFPTIFFVDSSGRREIVYGAKPYGSYEQTLLKLLPQATAQQYDRSWNALFAKYPSLTAKEFSELSGTERQESERVLDALTQQGKLLKTSTKNGSIWQLNSH